MSKTPRTLLENYLDASKTQTVKVARNQRVGLVRTPPEEYTNHSVVKPRLSRTPDPQTRSPFRSQGQYGGPQKYMSRTPEPYMHSTGKSRPQHDRVSTLRSKRRSVSSNDVEETPRQLLQGFLESEDTTAPLVRYASRTSQGRMSSSQPALSHNSGRSSSSRAGNWTIDVDSDTPRTLLQRYVLNTTDVIDTPAPRRGSPQQQTPELPVQQDTYHTPSPFKTNSTGSDVAPSPRIVRGKTPRSARRRKENFSISIMDSLNDAVDESVIPATNPADYEVPSPFRTTSSDDESFVPETQHTVHTYERSLHHRGGHFNISIPESMREEISQYRQSQRFVGETVNETGSHEIPQVEGTISDSENEQDYDEEEQTGLIPTQSQPGTNILPDWGEYTMPLKGNETDKSPVISEKVYRNSSFDEGHDLQQDRRFQDHRRMGRWSEGHQSRLQSPREGKQRSAEGQRRSMPGQMTVDAYFSPQQNMRHAETVQSPGRHDVGNMSTEDIFKHEIRSPNVSRRLSSRSSEKVDRMSGRNIDMVVDALSPARMRSYNDDVDELYTAQKFENSRGDSLHHRSLANISGNFSPKITSTQRNVTMDTHADVDDDDDLSTASPSPVVSPRSSQRSWSPSSSSRNSRSRVLMPSQRENQSTSVSPVGSSRSVSSRNSTRQSVSRSATPRQSMTPAMDISSHLTPGSSGRRSGSRAMTPLQTVTPSPVVSSAASSMIQSPSSLELQPSTRKSTPSGEPSKTGGGTGDSKRLERSRTTQNRSRSTGQTPSKSLVSSSPLVAGRRLAPDLVNTLPNNTANFSPQVASTQNLAAISRVGPGTIDRENTAKTDNNVVDDDNADDESHHGEDDRDIGDNEQWQDQMDVDEEPDNRQQSQLKTSTRVTETAPIRKKVARKPRQKSNYSLPVTIVKKHFTHYAGLRVSKEAMEEVMKVSEKYWDIMARDLEAYAKHAGRKQINMSDFVLLFKRQGHVTEKQSLKSLIEKYLPMEEREKLIPVARAGNRIDPKL